MYRYRNIPGFFCPLIFVFAISVFAFVLISPISASAGQVTLEWDANSEPVAGYRAFLREQGQIYDYSNPVCEGLETTCTIFDLDDDVAYHFVVRAYDTSGLESGDSNEVFYGPDLSMRVTANQLVLYAFEEGTGTRVYDVSGIGIALDLIVDDETAISWIAGGGLEINSSTVIKSAGAARKVIDAVKASDELTIEAWITPANTTQSGPARIVTLSRDLYYRNFTLGQRWCDAYDVRLRTTETSDNGIPSLRTACGALTNQLTHVVYTREVFGTIKVYIDGVLVASGTEGGNCSFWGNYALGLGNEMTGDRPWLGTYHMVAIFDRALDQAEIHQNFAAGPSLD